MTKNAVCQGVYLAVLGFLCVLLAGPVLAILGVVVSVAIAVLSALVGVFSALLPFILIGFLIYLPWCLLQEKSNAWRALGRVTGHLFQTLVVKPGEMSARLVRHTAAV